MKIFINPGHSPQWEIDQGIISTDPEPGACSNGLQENIIAASVGNLIEQECKNCGIEVVGNLQSSSLYEITDTANSTDADIFVSIHCNAAGENAKGTETFYCTGSSTGAKIASYVQKNIVNMLGTVDRGVKDDTQTQYSSGIHVLRHSNMAAILIELAFISNYEDSELLRNKQGDFARAIVKGLTEYANIPYADNISSQPVNSSSSTTSVVNGNTSIEIIGVLSSKYESNGDPACVANNAGDLGGTSYGKYQFASNVGAVEPFVNWLYEYPDPAFANYGRALKIYKVNSGGFIEQWIELGTIDPGNFGRLQDEYMMSVYYNGAVEKLKSKYFNAEKHSDAIKAVIFSRAVQNGITGCANLFEKACGKLNQPNLSYIDSADFDKQLITAIYDYLIGECDSTFQDFNGIWHSPDDFCHGSKQIIDALRNRFVHEKQDALDLL